MKAKSAVLSSQRPPPADKPANGKRRATARLPADERRAQIQAKAFEYFSEYGLTAQTRALAEACGVSQRLLYSAFPNKAALINAVYEAEIAGPFKAIWFVQLRDRTVPLAERLNKFYGEYYDTILTRRWLRLFLYASLAEVEIAPTYIAAIIRTLLLTIVEEAAFDSGLDTPPDAALAQEIGWVLHGNISHLAIRRHVYGDGTSIAIRDVISLHVAAFLAIVPTVLAPKEEATK
ncbi:TetR/AcrR family transcriptional regulator [Ramlibacter sp. AN1133]|uniref:TetR/AcrR family transcriptional regulator n=1 Tax=Ramlibacter sp. AN1133 TaxID=3133429 RepID=UPI0030BCC3B6